MEIGKREVEATLPLWLQTEMCYSDADRTILDELRKCAQAQTRKLEIQSGIEPLKQSIDQITEQLAVVQEYVTVSTWQLTIFLDQVFDVLMKSSSLKIVKTRDSDHKIRS